MKIELENAVVYQGSNLDVLPTLPDNSVDSIVTDPPYELGFMGKSWDNSGIAYSVELWRECMRVLKPGGHLLAFGGSRTWHRLAVAIEDAGFEMRDSIAWLYGSGFPKSMDISKQIDKQAGAEREVIGTHSGSGMTKSNVEQGAQIRNVTQWDKYSNEPVTDEAQQWQGWGTALKPAFEPIVVARKPLEEKTVAANVLKYGTGGLNIDGSRIGYQDDADRASAMPGSTPATEISTGNISVLSGIRQPHDPKTGRWPANIILDPYTAELLDEQSGQSVSRPTESGGTIGSGRSMSGGLAKANGSSHNDSGGASRFFYVAKASKKDRNEGLDELPVASSAELVDRREGSAGMNSPRAGAGRTSGSANIHPTVKPITLMEYLIKLVTPPNGTVLDPFTGSGSTGKAALLNGFKFIGIELTEEYLPIIEGRLKWASQQASKETNEVLF